ncbi:TIGR03557 family F420-dependent LLM class oxidoreductase [Tomitella fengzijianii]|uniref:TIGR03557 family F420-dependent LLM class oxidoreductase n=1 Tax=Tomitella fengzijianii TaxID=2597660 RepID=A0A516X2T4_9ACTN|nr:TIGR03557 family F420-dependent LLM class oxidoreductase [Tomitella fengzijianii]QDQ97357.1 TIGR03557 family F420-dependent LLM class oxidoreductase [Tomitella fengzijianii]
MVQIGYKLMAETFAPTEIVRQARAAEQAGFDFVEVSDHFHPWLFSHGHSGFAWSMLGAAAQATDRIGLATGVTCPFGRYHPAIIAQAAATTALLSDGRFTLGIGAGENLNEHVVGAGWPSVSVRHEMLRESVEIIRLLWSGGYRSYRGRHLQLDDARVFDLPGTPPPVAIAASGDASAALAGEHGDALFATAPDAGVVEAYRRAGGTGPRYAEVPLAWAPDEQEAARTAHKRFRFGLTGWKVQAELPNPVNFEAATAHIREDDVRAAMPCGPDPQSHLHAVGEFVAAGFDRVALMNAGPEIDGFFAFFADELAGPIRAMTDGKQPSRANAY